MARQRSRRRASQTTAPRLQRPELRKGSAARTLPGGSGQLAPGAELGLALLPLALTLLLYAGDLQLGFFVWDDAYYVEGNPWLQDPSLDDVLAILTRPYFANYAPATLLSYLVDRTLGGFDPWVYHLSSNLWAGLAAVGVYAVGRVLLGTAWAALAAALLFAVHPAHVEAVAWISSRKDLVATAFALPSLAAYLKARQGSRRRAWYAISVALFVPAIAAKLSVAVLPGVLALFDLLRERRRGPGVVLDKIPFLALALLFYVPTASAQPETRLPLDPFVAAHSLLRSLWLLTGLGDYVLARGRPAQETLPLLRALTLGAALLLFALPAMLWRRLPGTGLALYGWVVGGLVPPQLLSLIHPVADRYLFFSSAGLALLVVWAGQRMLEPRGRLPGIAATLACLVLLAGWLHGTVGTLRDWRDPRSVWRAAAERSGDVAVHYFLGSHYLHLADSMRADGKPLAQERFRELAELEWAGDPRLDDLLAEAEGGGRGRVHEAFRAHLQRVAGAELERALDAKGNRVMPNLFVRLGDHAMASGDFDRALLLFQQAYFESQGHTLESYRDHQRALVAYKIAAAYREKGDYGSALEWLAAAAEVQRQAGRNWLTDLEQERRRLEALAGPASGPSPP